MDQVIGNWECLATDKALAQTGATPSHPAFEAYWLEHGHTLVLEAWQAQYPEYLATEPEPETSIPVEPIPSTSDEIQNPIPEPESSPCERSEDDYRQDWQELWQQMWTYVYEREYHRFTTDKSSKSEPVETLVSTPTPSLADTDSQLLSDATPAQTNGVGVWLSVIQHMNEQNPASKDASSIVAITLGSSLNSENTESFPLQLPMIKILEWMHLPHLTFRPHRQKSIKILHWWKMKMMNLQMNARWIHQN